MFKSALCCFSWIVFYFSLSFWTLVLYLALIFFPQMKMLFDWKYQYCNWARPTSLCILLPALNCGQKYYRPTCLQWSLNWSFPFELSSGSEDCTGFLLRDGKFQLHYVCHIKQGINTYLVIKLDQWGWSSDTQSVSYWYGNRTITTMVDVKNYNNIKKPNQYASCWIKCAFRNQYLFLRKSIVL